MITAALIAASAAAGASGVCWEGDDVKLTDALRREYEKLFSDCASAPERRAEIEAVITRMMKSRERYERVGGAVGAPWFMVAVIHNMECSGRFDCHLHNGNSLAARTHDEPAGRPVTDPASGHFPYTWEESAIDALTYQRFHEWKEWTVAGALFKLESYNGFGTRNHGVYTPYLWGGSFADANGDGIRDAREKPIYLGGKYVRDHVWNPAASSKQIGAAVLLRRMTDQHLIDFPANRAE